MDLSTHERKINTTIDSLKAREAGRASEVGEDREEIGALLELTSLNKKAFAFLRGLDKQAEDKRADVLRSFDALRPLMETRWGTGTRDMFQGEIAQESDEFEREASVLSNVVPYDHAAE